jgi:lipopolysaccharide export system permease protein
MSPITRSLIFEMAKVFLTALGVIAATLIFSDIVKEMQLHDIPASQIVQLLPYVLPYAVKTGFHGALVFATCVTYGRFAASNELLAVKSMGISPMVMMWPAVLLGILLMPVGAWLHELDAGWGSDGVEHVLVDHADEIAYEMLETQGVVKRPEFTLVARDVVDRRLFGVTLFCRSPDLGREVTITAEEAELRLSPESDGLQITLRKGTVDGGGFHFEFPDTMHETLRMARARSEVVDRRMVSAQNDKVVELSKLLDRADRDESKGPVWDALREQLNIERRKLARAEAGLHYKWANASSCLFLVLLGAPVAMLMRLTDYVTNFFICFTPIVLMYQPLQRGPVHLAEAGLVPPYAVWLADLVVGAVGIWLLRIVVRR